MTIISSDKDLMQLVGGGVEMLDAMKNKRIDSEGVEEKFGVGPDRVVDVQPLQAIASTTSPVRPVSASRPLRFLSMNLARSKSFSTAPKRSNSPSGARP